MGVAVRMAAMELLVKARRAEAGPVGNCAGFIFFHLLIFHKKQSFVLTDRRILSKVSAPVDLDEIAHMETRWQALIVQTQEGCKVSYPFVRDMRAARAAIAGEVT